MLNIMRLCLGTIARLFCARRSLLLENLALRQQLAVFKRRHPRTRLTFLDKLFWVAARQICSDWGPAVSKQSRYQRTWRMFRRPRNLGYRIELPNPQASQAEA